MTAKTSIRLTRIAAAVAITATLHPLRVSAGVGDSRHTIPGVIHYDSRLPISEVPREGKAVDGLVVSLSTTTPTVKVKQAPILTVTIANTSSQQKIVWGPEAPCTYGFSVVNPSRNTRADVTPVECLGDLYSLPGQSVWPGTATRLQFKFDSDALIGEPGMYKVSVRSITLLSYQREKGTQPLPIASNAVSVVVTR